MKKIFISVQRKEWNFSRKIYKRTCKKRMKRRKEVQEKIQLPYTKLRRLVVKQERAVTRGAQEALEGDSYQSGKSRPIYIKVYYRNEQKLYCHHAFIPLHILYTYLNRYWSQLTSRHWKLTRSSCSRWLQTSDSAINRSNHIGYVWSWNNWSWWVLETTDLGEFSKFIFFHFKFFLIIDIFYC